MRFALRHPPLALRTSAARKSVPVQADIAKLLTMVPQVLFGVIRTALVAGPLLGVRLIPALLPATFGSASAALIEGAAGVSTIAAVTLLSISQLFSFATASRPGATGLPDLRRLQCSPK